MNIKPLQEFVLVRPVTMDSKIGKIYVSNKSAERDLKLAEVIKVGPGRDLEMGAMSDLHIEEGNIVIYTPDAMRVSLDGSAIVNNNLLPKGLVFVHARNIIGLIGAETPEEAEKLKALLRADEDTTLLEDDAIDREIQREEAWAGN